MDPRERALSVLYGVAGLQRRRDSAIEIIESRSGPRSMKSCSRPSAWHAPPSTSRMPPRRCANSQSGSAVIDEAASHAREALALSRRLRARASEAHALCLAGDVALTADAEDAPGYYREALARATELGMRPLVAHCHLGLGKLYRRTGKREQAQEHLTTATTMYREMDMRFWLEQIEKEMGSLR
jgi:tetratricopeptide (TPR) repeat protein